MLERLIANVGSGNIDRTLHIAAAWSSHKDPLPGLAITIMAQYDGRSKTVVDVTELLALLIKRVGKRTTITHAEAFRALLWWLSHECVTCHGLKPLRLADSPTLQDSPCPTCAGTGLRPHGKEGDGYARCLLLLDTAWDWSRRVSERMPMALEARELANA